MTKPKRKIKPPYDWVDEGIPGHLRILAVRKNVREVSSKRLGNLGKLDNRLLIC